MARREVRTCDRCQSQSDVAWYQMKAWPSLGACSQGDIGVNEQGVDLCGVCMARLREWFFEGVES